MRKAEFSCLPAMVGKSKNYLSASQKKDPTDLINAPTVEETVCRCSSDHYWTITSCPHYDGATIQRYGNESSLQRYIAVPVAAVVAGRLHTVQIGLAAVFGQPKLQTAMASGDFKFPLHELALPWCPTPPY